MKRTSLYLRIYQCKYKEIGENVYKDLQSNKVGSSKVGKNCRPALHRLRWRFEISTFNRIDSFYVFTLVNVYVVFVHYRCFLNIFLRNMFVCVQRKTLNQRKVVRSNAVTWAQKNTDQLMGYIIDIVQSSL